MFVNYQIEDLLNGKVKICEKCRGKGIAMYVEEASIKHEKCTECLGTGRLYNK